ncbi:MAG: BspA family leucine-rich repeat surface protein, partial [Cyclobacteriaceae bacterium]
MGGPAFGHLLFLPAGRSTFVGPPGHHPLWRHQPGVCSNGNAGKPGNRKLPWVHVFPDAADLVFINKTSGQQYVLEYNPNDFSTPNNITLPYGVYEYHSIVEGGIYSDFLPFEARGEFSLASQSLEISLETTTEYGLVTVKDQYVENASLSVGENETNLVEHEDGKYWYMYVKQGTETTLNIRESFQGSTISRELNIVANSHYNFVLKLNEDGAAITGLILAPFELEEEENLLGSGSAFYEENGTIKCPGAIPGEKGKVNGKAYEAVDRALLIKRRNEGAEKMTCVCTSLVTDMSGMFSGTIPKRNLFNQKISSWDVSNVVDMSSMFYCSDFNQNINNWDVGNVKNMNQMFSITHKFNQHLDSWDVSNVWDMSYMFYTANSFNQPIGNWDVGQVRNMEFMFSSASNFNQPIGNWNVSMVENMSWMFENISFNKPIGNWNVSNVTNMNAMFQDTDSFNQPIGNWDV